MANLSQSGLTPELEADVWAVAAETMKRAYRDRARYLGDPAQAVPLVVTPQDADLACSTVTVTSTSDSGLPAAARAMTVKLSPTNASGTVLAA